MAYGLKYTTSFSSDIDEHYDINFSVLGYTGLPQALTAAADCLELKSVVGDEDKFQPICGQEATIRIMLYATDNVSIADFIAPQDNFILVQIYATGNLVFQGFVMVEDNSQPLLDAPFVIEVKATDALGTLQGVYFLDTNGNDYSGKMTVIGWLAQILNKTGQTINLRTYFNIYNEAFDPAVNALEQICLDAITFQTGSQTAAGDTNPADFNTGFDDFYTVLEKIVTNLRCKLFQEAGYWHLVNLWDYMNPAGYTFWEYSFGDPVDGIIPYSAVNRGTGQLLQVQIGKIQPMRLVSEDAIMYLKLATKSVELTFNYNQALNKIINQALDQGVPQPAQDELIASSVIDASYNNGVSVNLTTKAYTLFGWLLLQCTAIGGSGQDIDRNNSTPMDPSKAFIRVVYDILSQEMVRFVVVKLQSAPTFGFIVSSRVMLDQNDILQITFSWRTRTGTGIGNARWQLAFVFLYGDDGTFWALNCIANGSITGNPTVWQKVDSDFKNTFGTVPSCSSDLIPSTLLWSGVEINTQALTGVPFAQAPTSGMVEVILYGANDTGTEWWYKDLSVTILPYLSGGYAKLLGDYNFAESNANIMKTEEDTVDISDSPKRYFQGALLATGAGYKLLSPVWNRAGYMEKMRFTQIMTWLIYTNVYRQIIKIEGTVRGLNYLDSSMPPIKTVSGMRNAYYFADTTTPTKRYLLCSFDKNCHTGQWRGVFLETTSGSDDPGLQTPDFSEFSYLFSGLSG